MLHLPVESTNADAHGCVDQNVDQRYSSTIARVTTRLVVDDQMCERQIARDGRRTRRVSYAHSEGECIVLCGRGCKVRTVQVRRQEERVVLTNEENAHRQEMERNRSNLRAATLAAMQTIGNPDYQSDILKHFRIRKSFIPHLWRLLNRTTSSCSSFVCRP